MSDGNDQPYSGRPTAALDGAQKARVLKRLGRERRRLTAVHEAGHVLARVYFGHDFDRAVVRSVAEVLDGPHVTERGHEIEVEGVVEGYDLCSRWTSPELLRARQGDTAEQRDAVVRHGFMSAEMEMMECFAGPIAEARFRHCALVAVTLTGGDEDWRCAEGLAAKWFPSDPGAALRLAEKRAGSLVRSQPGWHAIGRMAAVLVDRGVLDCEEATDIFAAAYGAPAPPLVAWASRWPPSLEMIRTGGLPPLMAESGR